MKMQYNEDLRQQLGLLLSTPEFTQDVEKFRNQNIPLDKIQDEVGHLMKKYHLPTLSYGTILHYLNHNEVVISLGCGFRYEKDPITNEWIEYIEFDPDFPTRYVQQAYTELSKMRLIPKKRKRRKSTYFSKNLTIHKLAMEGLPAKKIENELKKLGDKSKSDEWSIRQTAYRQRKRLKHNT